MKGDSRQTRFMIGIVLIIVALILLYVVWAQPRVYEEEPQTNLNQQGISTTIDINVNVSVCFPIDLNDATVDELLAIEGIGEKRATAIIEYRTVIGGYSSVEQIKDVNGIGDSLYDEISPYLTV